MSGGLIVLGFLFLAFLFRSAIVGDLAPVANARAPTPRALLPPPPAPASAPVRALPGRPFDAGREAARAGGWSLDRALDAFRENGVDPRVMQSAAHWKRVRLYRCLTCAHARAGSGCEYERGLLAGAFEALTGDLAKVHETTCAGAGAPFCEFEVRHAPLLEAV